MGTGKQPTIVAGRYVLAGAPRPGGMGHVYRAVDVQRDAATVAVKILDVPHDVDGIQATLFERERRNLAGLQHPNVVRLLDAGRLEEDGPYFLVLEWVERSLLDAYPAGSLAWDEYARVVGMPMLAGLAHAHERHVVHRDVKPSNVLVDAAGTPRLVDFGISKLKNRLYEGDRTVAGFGSAPYIPPGDPTSSSYSRDVYAAAVTFLACLTKVTIDSYSAVTRARELLEVPTDVGAVLDRALSADALERPENAGVFRDELAACLRRQRHMRSDRRTVYLSLTRTALDAVGAVAGVVDDEAVRRAVDRDLADGAHLASRRDYDAEGQPRVPDEFYLYGSRHRYHLLRRPHQAALTVVAAPMLQQARLDEARTHAWEAPYSWSSQRPLSSGDAEEVVRSLIDGLEEFYLDQDEQRTKRAEHRLFNQWLDLLAAKSELEARGERPLAFTSAYMSGRRGVFQLLQPPDEQVMEQRRVIRGYGEDRTRRSVGVVEEARDDKITLWFENPPSTLPSRGELVIDTRAARTAIERQRAAVNAIVHGTDTSREDLRGLLLDPARISQPVQSEIEPWFLDLDEDKRQAVAGAIGTSDAYLVEGPPGTGKTHFIVEFIAQTLKRDPDARILLSSQTHVALDNVLERLHRLDPSLRLARLGRNDDEQISPAVRHLMVESQVASWAAQARIQSEAFLDDLARRAGTDLGDARAALALSELAAVMADEERLKADIVALTEAVETGTRLVRRRVLDSDQAPSPLRSAAERSRLREVTERVPLSESERVEMEADLSDRHQRRRQIHEERRRAVDEAAATSGLDADFLDACEARDVAVEADRLLATVLEQDERLGRLVQVQSQWLKTLATSGGFEPALLRSTQVIAGTCIGLAGIRAMRDLDFDVCVLDEAGKATATEALVPMVRASRWVLVGDQRQLPPFQEAALADRAIVDRFGLDRAELASTLFDRLLSGAPSEARIMLTKQYRMAQPIAELISQCFYGKALATPRDRRLAGPALRQPVVWLDTSALPVQVRSEQRGDLDRSVRNPCEARLAAQRVQMLRNAVRTGLLQWTKPEPMQVLVLSGYRLQVEEIQRRIDALGHDSRITVRVRTIDEVQGQEADIAIVSLTRSNSGGHPGFLAFPQRVNVALSRGRYGLIIIGDAQLAVKAGGPLGLVVDHVRREAEDCAIIPADNPFPNKGRAGRSRS